MRDICKNDPAAFAYFVRQNDRVREAGMDAKLAWRLTLEAFEERYEGPTDWSSAGPVRE